MKKTGKKPNWLTRLIDRIAEVEAMAAQYGISYRYEHFAPCIV